MAELHAETARLKKALMQREQAMYRSAVPALPDHSPAALYARCRERRWRNCGVANSRSRIAKD
jgi:hypothetical protein